MAKGGWDVGTWNDAEWSSLPLTGVAATGSVGSVGHNRSNALAGAAATGVAGNVADSIQIGLSGVYGQGLIGDETESIIAPALGVAAQGQVGDLIHSKTVALAGAAATGQTGTLVYTRSEALSGVDASSNIGTLTPNIQPNYVFADTHDGDKHKKRLDEERKAKERRKQELISIYEQLAEGKPTIAEAIVKPYVAKPTRKVAEPQIDWNKLITDVNRVEALYREYQEMDDEDVLLLL